jgi:hypothetical protein
LNGSYRRQSTVRRLSSIVKRELRAGVLGLAVLGLLLVVALAARGGHPGGAGRASDREVPYAVQESLITLMVILYVVAVVVVLVLAFRFRDRWIEPESHWLRNFLAALALLLVIVLGYFAIARSPIGQEADEGGGGAVREPRRPVQVESVPARKAEFNWPLALSLGGLIVVGGVIVYFRSRRSRSPGFQATVEEDLARAVETTIDDLRREPDARRAVIAAYANMERVLAAHGLARRRHDAPREYLARVLGRLEVRESAIRTLTALFEYAKFSAHEIDSAMKDDAISALEAIRDDLRRSKELAA